jgi:predicted short-subunit dehydrogenase-like oxidoreductase (DUF2520 family)
MAARLEERAKIFAGLAGRVRRGDADAIEAEAFRLARERALEIGWREV